MLTLTSILVSAVLVVAGLIVANRQIMHAANIVSVEHCTDGRAITLKEEEILEAKTYAELFGLDNRTVPNVSELLLLGRKVTQAIGKERVHELAETVREYYSDAPLLVGYSNSERRSVSHVVRAVVRACRLIIINQVGMFLSHMTGGDSSDEESSNRI